VTTTTQVLSKGPTPEAPPPMPLPAILAQAPAPSPWPQYQSQHHFHQNLRPLNLTSTVHKTPHHWWKIQDNHHCPLAPEAHPAMYPQTDQYPLALIRAPTQAALLRAPPPQTPCNFLNHPTLRQQLHHNPTPSLSPTSNIPDPVFTICKTNSTHQLAQH
jgi:hypothetical protein